MLVRLLEYLPFVLPFYLVRFKGGPFPTTLLEVYLGLIIAAFLYEEGIEGIRRGWSNLGRFRSPVIAWFVATLLAVFASPSLWTGLGLWRAYVLEPLVIFFILNAVTIDRIRFIRHLFLTTIALTVWALVQFMTGKGIPHPWNVAIDAGRRATGPFRYPNALALFVVPIGAYALSLVGVDGVHPSDRRSDRAHAVRPYVVGTIAASFLAVLLAKSDGGLIALGFVTWLVLMLQKRFRPWIIAATCLGLLATALVPAIRKPIIHELTFQGWSGKVRMYMWRDSWAMLKDRPLFGAGFGGYPTVFKPYQRTTGIEVFQYPHNILLNFWSETGLLGVLAFMWILFVWVRRFTITDPRCAIPLVILIHGLVDAPYFKNDLALLFWILIWLTTTQIDASSTKTYERTH